jgi:hypothetical protein
MPKEPLETIYLQGGGKLERHEPEKYFRDGIEISQEEAELIQPSMEDTPSDGELEDALRCIYAGLKTRHLFDRGEYWLHVFDSLVDGLGVSLD